MLVKKLRKMPPAVMRFMEVVSKEASLSGFRIYLVGGIVRDFIVNNRSFDYDIVVEGDAIEFARRICERLKITFIKHHSFGTATIYYGDYKIDLATCRREHYSHWGALPKVSPAGIKEDL
ncbi:MAG: polynucleotide adenylyltransferase, partial [Candidatus Omnitrophota bacterium]